MNKLFIVVLVCMLALVGAMGSLINLLADGDHLMLNAHRILLAVVAFYATLVVNVDMPVKGWQKRTLVALSGSVCFYYLSLVAFNSIFPFVI